MKKYLLVVLVIFISHIARSQCMQIEIPLEERINASSIIVEGEVLSKQSYWDAKQQNIFTVNTVKPYKTFKGSLSNTAPIEIITLGGIVGNTRLDVSNALQLNAGDIGMFLLKTSSVALTKSGNFLTTVEGAQGYIKYDRYEASASDGFKLYTSVVNELYTLIESRAGRSFTTLETVNLFQDSSNRRLGSISSISPTIANAGVGDILTINGSGFGTVQGFVHFKDSDTGGTGWKSTFSSDIISWSDTQIQVKVVWFASTGRVRVITSANETIANSPTLTVNWAHSNLAYNASNYESNLIAKNANGGYEFKFAPNFNATDAQASFNRSLATWNCGSGVNFESAGSTAINIAVLDETSLVLYSTETEMGTGTVARANTWSGRCDVGGSFEWLIIEVDIEVNTYFNFSYSTSNPSSTQYDFETVALHELGHAHQLGHVRDVDDVMYYNSFYGETIRDLNLENLNAANYVMNKSTTTSVCGEPMMTPYAGSICCNDPEITVQPINVTNCTNDIETFTITANYATNYQWEVNTGSAWATISNNTIYSGAQSSTLSVTNITTSMNSYQYRCIASNSCTNTATSNAVTLTVDKPEVTLSATEETPCDTNDGTITFTFLDNPNRTGIQFSIDGGTTYTSIYEDNIGSVTLTGLAPNTYSVYSKWGNGQCEVEIGNITVVERNNPEATVASSTPSDCSSATGSVTLNWVVDPIRTNIEFSTDGGVSYPHSTTNPSGTITIGSLPAGTTDLWVRWGNADCPIDMEDVTIGNSNCDFSNGFITTWETANDGTTNSNSIAIPIASTGTYNYHVDWGDGQFDYNVTGGITHPYATPGTYQVKIIGYFPHIYFNNTGDKQKILSVEQWGANSWSSMENAFHGCNNLIINATDNPDLSDVTDMSYMFTFCSSFNADISTWDVSSVVSMAHTFRNTPSFNQDIGGWDVSMVTNMNSMFWNANVFNQDISAWDVSSVTNMSLMFRSADNFNQDIGAWDVGKVTNMNLMLAGALSFDQNLGNWDISSVTNMSTMFFANSLSIDNYDATLIGWSTLVTTGANPETQIPENINFGGGDSKFCAGEAARTSLMSTPYSWTIIDGDKDCPDLPFITTWQTTAANETITIPTTGTGYNYDIDWDNNGTFDDFGITGNATHTYATAGTHTIAIRGDFPRIYFNYGSQRTKIVSIDQWGTGSWTNMRNAFMGCNNLVINAADSPDLSNVTDMSSMFAYNAALNQNLNHWDVTNITNMQLMFYQATAFNQELSNWNVGNVTNMNNMFNNATSFNQDLSTWNVRQVTTMNGMFYNAIAFDQDIGDWDISAVLNIDAMFENVTLSVINYDNLLIGWNTQDVGETIPLNLTFHAGDSNYCNGDAARDNLITTHGWSITDGNSCVGFVTTWETTTANETITIPTTGAGYNYDIDWESDGIYDDFGVTGNATHTYVNPGIYTVTIKGDFPQIYFNYSADRNKILAVEKWGISSWRSMQNAFAGCSNLVIIAGDNPDLSNVTNMSHMFSDVATIIQDLSSWDVSNVTDMSYTFDDVNSFNQDISSWDVSNVTDMSYMFRDASAFNKDINSWNVSNVTNMSFMFSSTNSFNQNLSSWDVSGVTDMSYMFYYAFKFNQDISSWDVSSVTTMENMFATATDFNRSLSSWDVSSVTNMASMFNNADDFNADLSGWNVGNVTTMESMFSEAAVFNQDINSWNVINVSNMSNLFYEASAFNQELSNWDVDNVASMSAMFASASAFNKDISSWNVGSVTDMFAMFSGASAFNQNIGAWNVGSVTDMSYMFSSSGVFNQDLGSWNVSNVKYMIGMFHLSTAFNQDLGNWDIGLVTNMTNMFYGVTLSISNYDNTLIGWNTIVVPETQIQTGVSFSGGNSKYCAGEAAKDNLTNPLGHSWTIIDEGSNCAVISPKVILQGAALNPNTGEETLMRDDLRVAGLLPATSPYSDGIEVNATVFNTGGTLGTGPIADDIVDWVFVELRDAANSLVTLASQSALLQRDGNVVAIDGLSSLSFDLGADNYYVVVKHRNHLGVMTAHPVALGVFAPTVDFTDANNPITYGYNAQSSFGMPSGILGMWTGDANNDGRLNYLGTFSESPSIRNQVFTDTNNSVFGGPPSPSYSSLGYFNTDVDMNGSTKYLGTLSDVLSVRNNIFNNPSNSVFGGPPSPTYLFLQQLPEGANN